MPVIDDAAYVGAIPTHYHEGIGPFLFEPFAQLTAERVRAFGPRRVLETAAGTGIVTRRLRAALAADARLVATDLNEPMLSIARRALGPEADVRFVQADMCQLRFPDGEFDAVVCNFGLMFVPDKLAAMREARRVLARDGRLFLATWAPLERNPVVLAAHQAVGAQFPSDPPQYLRRAPFGYGDPDVLEALLVRAGFSNIIVDVVERPTRAPGARSIAVGLVEGYPLVDEIKARGQVAVPAVVDAVAEFLVRQYGQGPIKTRIAALCATATA